MVPYSSTEAKLAHTIRQAHAWEGTARQHAADSDYWRERCLRYEKAICKSLGLPTNEIGLPEFTDEFDEKELAEHLENVLGMLTGLSTVMSSYKGRVTTSVFEKLDQTKE